MTEAEAIERFQDALELIADYLKISIGELRKKYVKRVGLRSTLIEQAISKDCVFLQNIDGHRRCSIYPVRPRQCRTWPFWANNLETSSAWNQAAQRCLGVNRGKLYSFDEILRIKKGEKWWLRQSTPK